ncbi:preprotein translocase subunit SecE [Bombiscardovia coagulans]|uniref:Protein translocase subunit SecE n=1 Tax=Bombiscardovia coagulans TaxID=686666 RepID=A0A261EQ09_9BIFI|nr:preprotein translocase subunit SecE [Bombiscardovia coagulans]OZG48940.1 preprotein translocase subunit SecE [Bombiscardovia coagulans]
MAKKEQAGNSKRPNIFQRIGMFIKQVFDEIRKVVAPTGKELLGWSVSVFVFVLFLMIFVTTLDFGLGKLVMLIFG